MGTNPEFTKKWALRVIKQKIRKHGLDIEPEEVLDEVYDETLTQAEISQRINEFFARIVPVDERIDQINVQKYVEMAKEWAKKGEDEEFKRMLNDAILRVFGKIPEEHPHYREYEKQIRYLWESKTKHILFIWGDAGIGKSTLVREILQKSGIEYVELGDPTPEGLFEAGKLFSDLSGKKGVLLLDETTLLMQSKTYPRILHLLNQMGNSIEHRIVARPTKKGQKEKEIESYEFYGKIIILANDPHFVETRTAQATKDRMIIFHPVLTKEQRNKLIVLALTKKFGERGKAWALLYYATIRATFEHYRLREAVKIGFGLAGVRKAIEFAERCSILGVDEAIRWLVQEIIEGSEEYYDAYVMSWGEFSAKYPTITINGWKYRRRIVREILKEQKSGEIQKVIDRVLKEITQRGE